MTNYRSSCYLFGGYNRGKTHLAIAQYRKLIELELPCMFFTMAELLSELRKAELDLEYISLVQERVRESERFHLLVDDIDKFKVTDFKFEVLYDLINTIYTRKIGLTITSNYNLLDLQKFDRLHPAIVRRIDDICKVIEV